MSLIHERKRWAIALIVVAAVIAFAWVLHRARLPEPEYEGKSISAWLDELPLGKDDCRTAIHGIGTNGLPFAVRRLTQHDSIFGRKYSQLRQQLPAFVRNALPRPNPSLRDVDGANWFSLVGSNSIPYAISLLKHNSPTVRQATAWGLGSLRRQTAAVDQAVPGLIDALEDGNRDVRFHAVLALIGIGPTASNAVPALRKTFTRARLFLTNDLFLRAAAARALGHIGASAAGALPDLRAALLDQNAYLRGQAAVAVWRIDGDLNTALPILLQEMSRTSENHKEDWVVAIGEMGTRARETIPYLRDELAQAREPTFLEEVMNTLNKVDPEANKHPQ
jgi:HEAT repeat protein/PBS lyase HEAT-like repeat-containing protein